MGASYNLPCHRYEHPPVPRDVCTQAYISTGHVDFPLFLQNATVLAAKQEFHRMVPSCPPYQQRLLVDNPREELAEDRVLSSYPSLKTGSTINLLRIPPWELHVTDMYGRQHTVAVPSIKPKVVLTMCL